MLEIKNFLNNKKVIKNIVIFYHLLFCFFTLFYTLSFDHESDAEKIFRIADNANNWMSLFSLGTGFVSFLIYPLTKIGFNYYILTFLFSLISLKGYLIYIDLFFQKNSIKNKLFILILMIPSYHYWTSFIGKDALVFYFMAIILSFVFNKKRVSFLFFVSLSLILFIRPYIFFIVLFCFILDYIFNTDIKLKLKTTVIFVFITIGLLALPILQKFLKLDILTIENIKENYNQIIFYSQQNGNSSIDLQNSNYLERLILVLFRPFVFERFKQVYILLASIENTLVWFVVFKISLSIKRINLNKIKTIIYPLMCFVLLVLFYSIYMYNLGLASRMRVMYMPNMLFSLYWIFLLNRKTN